MSTDPLTEYRGVFKEIPNGAAPAERHGQAAEHPRSFCDWLFGWTSKREARLKRKVRLLRARLEAVQLENELLAALNENLRRWVLSNTAAAVHAAECMGFFPNEVKKRGP